MAQSRHQPAEQAPAATGLGAHAQLARAHAAPSMHRQAGSAQRYRFGVQRRALAGHIAELGSLPSAERVRVLGQTSQWPALRRLALETCVVTDATPTFAAQVWSHAAQAGAWACADQARWLQWLVACGASPPADLLAVVATDPPVNGSTDLLRCVAQTVSGARPTVYISRDPWAGLVAGVPMGDATALCVAWLHARDEAELHPEVARQILRSAIGLQRWHVVASLFEEGHSDRLPHVEAARAFHALAWHDHGDTKIGYLQRCLQAKRVPQDVRLGALCHWVGGNNADAIRALLPLVSAGHRDPALAREWLMVNATAQRTGFEFHKECLDVVEAAQDPANFWLRLLAGRDRPERILALVHALGAVERSKVPALPHPTDPVFAQVALTGVSHMAATSDAGLGLDRFLAYLTNVEPLWQRCLAPAERHWLQVVLGVRKHLQDAAALSVQVRNALALPIHPRWTAVCLQLLRSVGVAKLVSGDELPTALGALCIDLCVRTVYAAEARGLSLDSASQAALCSNDPQTIISHTVVVLQQLPTVGRGNSG